MGPGSRASAVPGGCFDVVVDAGRGQQAVGTALVDAESRLGHQVLVAIAHAVVLQGAAHPVVGHHAVLEADTAARADSFGKECTELRRAAVGQVRADLPLRLMRSLVFGPMEHVLWDATLAKRHLSQAQIDTTADELIEVLWTALQPPAASLTALAQFRQDVEEASRRFEEAASREK